MKRPVLVLILTLLSITSFAASFDPSLEWKTITSEHFNVHYGARFEREAALVSRYLEEAHAEISPKIGFEPWGRTEVIVTDNFDSANGMSSTLPYNWMLIRLASPDPDSVLSDYDNWLRTLCFHEYTHIIHLDQVAGVMKVPRYLLGKVVAPNGTVPGWMREGIATYFETSGSTKGRGYSTYSEMMLRTAILENDFPKIDEADGLGWRWPGYQSMYIYGVKFLEYIADNYGEEKLMDFHNHVARSPLLYGLNHQARKVFSDIRFEPRKVHNRYERVRKKGTPRSKSFYNMWNEWKARLEKEYAEVKEKVMAEGLTEFKKIATEETVLSSPAVSPDGRYLAYARYSERRAPEIHLVDLATGKDRVVKKRHLPSSISFSPDSRKFVYAASGGHGTYNVYNDIYEFDIEKGRSKRLTFAARSTDPSYTPDGKKIIFVSQDKGTGALKYYDIESERIEDISLEVSKYDNGRFVQFATPAVSPDGRLLAVVSWQTVTTEPYPMGRWDLYVYDLRTGKIFAKLTDDSALDTGPAWDPGGRYLYYSSDRTGINNIYRIDIKGRQTRLTNVLTGVFKPAVSPDGRTLYVEYYNGRGFDIRSTELPPADVKPKFTDKGNGDFLSTSSDRRLKPGSKHDQAEGLRAFKGGARFSVLPKADTLAVRESEALEAPQTKKYSPFGRSLFLPRFVIPNFAIVGDGVMFAAMTGGADPLRWHNWTGGATYRTDLTDYVGYFFNYFYNRYKPVLSAGITGYAVNFGNMTFLHSDGTKNTVHLFEERRRLYAGIAYPWKNQTFGLQYFWENRRPNSGLTPEEKGALNFGNFAGFNLSYSYGKWEKYLASISAEHGRKLRLYFTITDRALGSSLKNEQYIFIGDYREYINMPWENHVLALRASGGMVWGDEMVQGTFTMGGALGEGNMGGGDSPYYFMLRGLPVASLSKTRAMLLSGEYRIPIWSPQRGLGTLPFYLQNVHLAPFADYGNAWNSNQDTGSYFFNYFFLGTGAEIRADAMLGHGLPVTGRIGYAIIVLNRDRLGNTKDPILNTLVKNGVLIVQLGTSF